MSETGAPQLIKPDYTIFPLAYGNEEESGLMDDYSGEMDEPYLLASQLRRFVPTELQSTNRGRELFLLNGSKIYAGGAVGTAFDTNVERATAECISPSQLNVAIRAGEQLLIKTVESYVTQMSAETGRTITARSHRRVVDSHGSRKACHDNYGLDRRTNYLHRDFVKPQLLGHLASRSFVTGAGNIRGGGLDFAQKIGGLQHVIAYDYVGSMLRFTNDEGTPRMEIRCSDINVSDWAVRMRIGSVAMVSALAQIPDISMRLRGVHEGDAIQEAKVMNRVYINRDGTLGMHEAGRRAVDFQQTLAELFLTDLPKYVDEIPEELVWTAEELYEYCTDFRKILRGDATIGLLADRADWAAKFDRIKQNVDRDQARGIKRTMKDVKSRAADLKYDYRQISATAGTLEPMRLGWGYKLRERGNFRNQPKASEAERLYRKAPIETRAGLRASLLANYDVRACDWKYVAVVDGRNLTERFNFADVTQTALSPEEQELLESMPPKA